MGLDITLMKLNKEGGERLELIEDECYPDEVKFFEHFSSEIREELEEFIDWEATFKARGLDYSRYISLGIIRGLHTFGTDKVLHGSFGTPSYSATYLGSWDKDKARDLYKSNAMVDFLQNELKTVRKLIDVIRCDEVGYQRKSMDKDFFLDFLMRGFPERDNPRIYVHTKEDFEKMKEYALPEAPILDWEFKEGKHFIYLSY